MPILPIDSGRYGSKKMREIFEEKKKLQYQLDFEAEVALAQAKVKLIPKGAANDISKNARSDAITLERVKKLEKTTEHDTAAVVEALSERCALAAKPWVHYGLTSSDVVDTSMCIQLMDAFEILEPKLSKLCLLLIEKAKTYAKTPAVGRTHGQHASIISFGLKFAVWANEIAQHIDRIKEGKKRFLICKTLGVVGTGSLMGVKAVKVQAIVAQQLGLHPIEAATQIIPRERFAEVQFIISLIGSTLEKIGTEIRNLQRTEIGELQEPFREGQIGSSAVPVKKNPIKSERVCSLARILRSLLTVSFENIPSWHERDLTNSANERFTLPISLILLDEMLNAMLNVIDGLKINENRIRDNIEISGGQIYSEFILEALIKKGIPRFSAYREIQRLAFQAKDDKERFYEAVKKDPMISRELTISELKRIFNAANHLSASRIIITKVANRITKAVTKSRIKP
jgi:adenylosuccinate lyase